MDTFGILKRVELRELWPKEAYSFTPWIAANLPLLSAALGMDLELKEQEAPVGPFSLDLLARDLGSDRVVVIENQLEQTDHDHLGKLLTYAAGHEASVAVWIASAFREEHRQALDWLNGRTDSATAFFGIVNEALQIDDSRPAPNFRIVASPNDFRKGNIGGATAAKLSVKGENYQIFFQDLIDRLRTQHHFTNAKKGQPQSWYTFSAGITGLSYGANFPAGNKARAELYIDRGDQAGNKAIFEALLQRRPEIEAAFGESLAWERLETKRASRIAIYRDGNIEESGPMLEEIKMWLIAHLLKMKSVFGPRLAQAVASVPVQSLVVPTMIPEQ